VSRRHAAIKRDGTRFYLTALQTLNPTRVDGLPFRQTRRCRCRTARALSSPTWVSILLFVLSCKITVVPQ
jgi:pSer/pThr/pTyr-binding forkhead associated (FHA) protein